ncbi:MAG: tetratricopeptide repeat protein, partial [Planctomycetota bacterium]
MRKERSERYRSASELADDIENYLNGVPLIAGPPTTIYRLKKFVRRNRLLSAAVLTVAVTLFLGLAATTAMYLRSERALGESQAIADFFTKSVLSAISDANANEQNLSYILDTTSKNLEAWSDKPPLVEASIRNTLGWTYKNIDQPAKAAHQLETALKIYDEHLGEGYEKTNPNMFALAHVYMNLNRWDEAERMLKRQVEIVQREHRPDHEIPLNALGCLYYSLGRYKEAEDALQKKLEIVRRNKGSNAGYGWYTANLAKVYRYQGRYEEAEDLYKKTLEMMMGWEPNHSLRLDFTRALACVYRDQGRYPEAEGLYKRVMEKQIEIYGEKSAVWTMTGLAQVYTDQGLLDKADELLAKIDEISDKSVELYNLFYIDTKAVLKTKQKHFHEAECLFERALEIRKQRLNRWADDHPDTLKTKNDLAVLYKEQARYEEAEKYLLEAVEGRRLKLGDEH